MVIKPHIIEEKEKPKSHPPPIINPPSEQEPFNEEDIPFETIQEGKAEEIDIKGLNS